MLARNTAPLAGCPGGLGREPGPGRPGGPASERQQFYQCCACNEMFSSAKNVRIHITRMEVAAKQAGLGLGSRSPRRAAGTRALPVGRAAQREALAAAHSSVCQWQLVEIDPAGVARGRRGGVGAGVRLAQAGGSRGVAAAPAAGPCDGRAEGGAAGELRGTGTIIDLDSEIRDAPPDTEPGKGFTITYKNCTQLLNFN